MPNPLAESKAVQHLRCRIQSGGLLPFDEFMRDCLYAPDWGYYTKSPDAPGRKGDFYTSVSTGPVFGRLLADHMVTLWSRHFPAEPLTIVEQGAHWGQMALDILDVLQKKEPECYTRVRYQIIEPGPALQARQQQTLLGHQAKVRWHSTVQDAVSAQPKAFFLSNELLDSFPVKRFAYTNGAWNEFFVDWEEGKGFVNRLQPSHNPLLLRERDHWPIPEMEGYQVELCPEARHWIKELAGSLASGFILTVDYGFTAPELYAPSRPQGTLSCYSQHRRDDNPLIEVGEKDITTHINFSLLMEEAAKASWETVYFKDQHHALIEMAQGGFLRELEETMARDPRDKEAQAAIRQFQTLTHPGIMGTQFKFLLQSKGI